MQVSFKDTCIYYNRENWLGGWGFCDLYNKKTGEVWELKKDSDSKSCQKENAEAQLNNYIRGRLKYDLNRELKLPNTTHIAKGTFTCEILGYDYLVNYREEENGILRYSYNRTKTEQRKEIEETAISIANGAARVIVVVVFLLTGMVSGVPVGV